MADAVFRAMTQPRILVEGSCHALTRRTVGRKAFLAPWHPLVRDIIVYALADAQRKTGVDLHWAVSMPNHLHLGVTSVERNLDVFMREAMRDISKALNRLLWETGYEGPGQLWDNDKSHWTRLLTSEAMFERCVYDFGNPMVAGLVERSLESPMLMRSFHLWGQEGEVIAKPPVYFGKDRPAELLIKEVPPGLLFEAANGDMVSLGKALWDASEDQRRGWAKVRGSRRFMGSKELRQLHPYNEPRTPRQRGRRAPEYALGNHPDAPELHRKVRSERKGFDEQYNAGLQNADEMMPNGALYEVLVRKRAMAKADPHAILCGRGLTFAEAQARLANGAAQPGCLESLVAAATASLNQEREECSTPTELRFRCPENRDEENRDAENSASATRPSKPKVELSLQRAKQPSVEPQRVDLPPVRAKDPLPIRAKSPRQVMDQWHGERSAAKVVSQHAPRAEQRIPSDGRPPAPRLVVLRGKPGKSSGDPPV